MNTIIPCGMWVSLFESEVLIKIKYILREHSLYQLVNGNGGTDALNIGTNLRTYGFSSPANCVWEIKWLLLNKTYTWVWNSCPWCWCWWHKHIFSYKYSGNEFRKYFLGMGYVDEFWICFTIWYFNNLLSSYIYI